MKKIFSLLFAISILGGGSLIPVFAESSRIKNLENRVGKLEKHFSKLGEHNTTTARIASPLPPQCGDASAPSCNGTCPSGQSCTIHSFPSELVDDCECVDDLVDSDPNLPP